MLRRTLLEECASVGWLENGCCLEVPSSLSNHQWESSPSTRRSRSKSLGNQKAGKSTSPAAMVVPHRNAGVLLLQQGHHRCSQSLSTIYYLPETRCMRCTACPADGTACEACWSGVSPLGNPSVPSRAPSTRKNGRVRRGGCHRPTLMVGTFPSDADRWPIRKRAAVACDIQAHHDFIQFSGLRARPRFFAPLPIFFEAWRRVTRFAQERANLGRGQTQGALEVRCIASPIRQASPSPKRAQPSVPQGGRLRKACGRSPPRNISPTNDSSSSKPHCQRKSPVSSMPISD